MSIATRRQSFAGLGATSNAKEGRGENAPGPLFATAVGLLCSQMLIFDCSENTDTVISRTDANGSGRLICLIAAAPARDADPPRRRFARP